MTDETTRVNVVFGFGLGQAPNHRVQICRSRRDAVISGALAAFLAQEMSGPGKERVELIRIEQKINDESDRGQHEHDISHGCPCAKAHESTLVLSKRSSWSGQ